MLTQQDAATVLGVSQPKVSALRRYKLAGFSVERLMMLLTALDQDIEIVIKRKPPVEAAGTRYRGARMFKSGRRLQPSVTGCAGPCAGWTSRSPGR